MVKIGSAVFSIGLIIGIVKVFYPLLPISDGFLSTLMIAGVLFIGFGAIVNTFGGKSI